MLLNTLEYTQLKEKQQFTWVEMYRYGSKIIRTKFKVLDLGIE